MALATLVAISGPKKVSIFRPPPPKMALVMDFPPQNHYVPHHINNRYINSYIIYSREIFIAYFS